jgi:hypothetical protein
MRTPACGQDIIDPVTDRSEQGDHEYAQRDDATRPAVPIHAVALQNFFRLPNIRLSSDFADREITDRGCRSFRLSFLE